MPPPPALTLFGAHFLLGEGESMEASARARTQARRAMVRTCAQSQHQAVSLGHAQAPAKPLGAARSPGGEGRAWPQQRQEPGAASLPDRRCLHLDVAIPRGVFPPRLHGHPVLEARGTATSAQALLSWPCRSLLWATETEDTSSRTVQFIMHMMGS